MKKFVIFVFLLALVLAVSGTIFANGFNLNGVGAKAIGMGGAFIGMADDFSAVYWNPAGLTQLDRPTLTLFQMNLLERGKFSFTPTGTDTKTDLLFYPSGAIGFITPLSSRVTAGIVAYVPSGLGTKWNGDDLVGYPGVKSTAQWESQVAVITLSPVIAYKVAEGVSLGASLNINYGLIKLKRPAVGQYSEESDDIGINATFGLHLRPTSRLGMGITWKTPTKFTFTGDSAMSGASLYRLSTEAAITRATAAPRSPQRRAGLDRLRALLQVLRPLHGQRRRPVLPLEGHRLDPRHLRRSALEHLLREGHPPELRLEQQGSASGRLRIQSHR